MDGSVVPAAVTASREVATRHGLPVEGAVILQDSNRLTVHLQPCDLIARVADQSARAGAEREVALATRLGETTAPVAPLDPRVEPRVFDEKSFAITFWAYCRPVGPSSIGALEYAETLARLHAGMREIDPGDWLGHFMDRVTEAQGLVDDPANRAAIPSADRDLVSTTLRDASEEILTRVPAEQLLHGEPHPGNTIRTNRGLVFFDLETMCHGPVEFDIAHATIVEAAPPTEVARLYPGADVPLVRECWRLALALAVACRFESGDNLPNAGARAQNWAQQLRNDVGRGTDSNPRR